MNQFGLFLALGLFLGNWLVVPLFFPNRTHKDGFFIGVIVAILAIAFCVITNR